MGRLIEEDAIIKIVAYECGEFVGLAKEIEKQIKVLPSAQPEDKPINYYDCANALLMMWMDNVLTDSEYYRISDRLIKTKEKQNEDN